jgi:hypothetical protein
MYALLYQFVVSVGTGEILLFSGPFKGAAAGVTIACQTILHRLHPGERIWGDKANTTEFRVITPTHGKWFNKI